LFAGMSQLATRAMSIAGGTSEITRNQIAEGCLLPTACASGTARDLGQFPHRGGVGVA
jgi:hypothetical protein